jgi:hypothetical protein
MNDAEALAFAERVLKLAWADLPPAHRSLLESIGAEGWDATARPLGTYADELLRSAGYTGLDLPSRIGRDRARGLWIPELRVVLVNAVHPDYEGLDRPSRENALARRCLARVGSRPQPARRHSRGRGGGTGAARVVAERIGRHHPIGWLPSS